MKEKRIHFILSKLKIIHQKLSLIKWNGKLDTDENIYKIHLSKSAYKLITKRQTHTQ